MGHEHMKRFEQNKAIIGHGSTSHSTHDAHLGPTHNQGKGINIGNAAHAGLGPVRDLNEVPDAMTNTAVKRSGRAGC